MKTQFAIVAALAVSAAFPSWAAGDLSRANVQEVTMEMGTNDDGMYFSPNEFVFETGKAYKMVMTNVDDVKHEVTFGEGTEKMFTRKIEITTPDDALIAEIKGHINEVEIGPHQTVEWFFVPIQPKDFEIKCEIEGHYELGMHANASFK
jgi:uncharacterized cupredoxin-like copper-binding protein